MLRTRGNLIEKYVKEAHSQPPTVQFMSHLPRYFYTLKYTQIHLF